MKSRLRIRFVGKDWDKLEPGQIPHPFTSFLSKKYIIDTSGNPDYVISKESRDFYRSYLKHHPNRPIGILFAGEAFTPDFNIFDYAIGFDHLNFGDRYFRLHTLNFFNFELPYGSLEKKTEQIDKEYSHKSRFCNFIYSNSKSHHARKEIFNAIHKRKHVDAAGKLLNNSSEKINGSKDWRKEKIEYQKKYKFTIAAENAFYPGYTTEKILHPMFAMSIPIYWGNPRVSDYFNNLSFINIHEYDSLERVADHVMELDTNESSYRAMLEQPWMTPSQEKIISANNTDFECFLANIFDQPIPDARRRGDGTWVWAYEKTLIDRMKSHDTVSKSVLCRLLAKIRKW